MSPALGLWGAQFHDDVSQKRRVLSLAGSGQRLADYWNRGLFPDQLAQVSRKFSIFKLAHETGSFYSMGCSVGSSVSYHLTEARQRDFVNLRISVMEQTFDRRPLNSGVRTIQIRPHDWNRIFLADDADDVDRFRLNLSIFVLE